MVHPGVAGRQWHRWEVWQDAGSGPGDWGHLRKDLMDPAGGVGAGPSWGLAEWRNEPAARLSAILNDPVRYPHRDSYRYVPGPNSNTYAAWVLREAAINLDLPPAAIGSGYR